MDKDASLQKQIHNNFNKLVEKAIHIQEITHFNQKRLKDMKVQRARIGWGNTELGIKGSSKEKPKMIPQMLGSEAINGKVEIKSETVENEILTEKEKKFLGMIDERNKEAHLLTEFVIEERLPAFLIALMQFLIAISTEIISMLMLNGQREIFDVIVNFIAIKVIAEIDNIFIDGISDVTLIRMTEPADDEEWTPKRIYNKIPFSQRGFLDKILFAYYKVLKLVYNSFYFYFFPFLIILFNIISRRCEDIYDP